MFIMLFSIQGEHKIVTLCDLLIFYRQHMMFMLGSWKVHSGLPISDNWTLFC